MNYSVCLNTEQCEVNNYKLMLKIGIIIFCIIYKKNGSSLTVPGRYDYVRKTPSNTFGPDSTVQWF